MLVFAKFLLLYAWAAGSFFGFALPVCSKSFLGCGIERVNPFTTGNPFWGTNNLVLVWGGVLGFVL